MKKHSPSAGNADADLNKPVHRLINVLTTGFVALPLLASLSACEVNDVKYKNAKVSAAVDNNEIDEGAQVTLSWSTKDAGSCQLSDGTLSKIVPTNGKEILSPIVDTTYTINCSATGKGKPAEAAAQVRVVPLPKASIAAKTAQIYIGETVSIEWSCSESDRADLSINGEPSDSLSLTGSDTYSLPENASFELTCANARGKTATAKTHVTVIAETYIKPEFDTLADLSQAIDISSMTADCGPSCLYAPFDQARFSLGADGIYRATEAYRAELEKRLPSIPGKVMLSTSRTVAFDFAGSFGYGHRESVNDQAQQKVCDQGYPFAAKGSTLSDKTLFIDEIESGIEDLGLISQPEAVAFDIEVSAKALAGVMKAGSEATLSYKVGALEARAESLFMDYDKVKGSYKLNKDGSIRLSSYSFSPRSASFPSDGWSCAKPPQGVSANNHYPEPTSRDYFGGMINPNQDGCRYDKFPYFQTCIKEPGQQRLCYYERAQPIDLRPGWQKFRSPRVATGFGVVQCKTMFGQVAENLGLKDDWTAPAELQYFVHDPGFSSQCQGASCVGKTPRESENDWRFLEVEPANNRCINRWEGLDWNSYRASLQAACFSTPLYREALAKQEARVNDEKFGNACRENQTCRLALVAMSGLAQRFSPQTLSDIIDKEVGATQRAKAEGISYFITEAKLSHGFIAEARAQLSLIEAGLDTIQSLHASNKSSWTSANRLIHSKESIFGFDSYQEAKNTLPAYRRQLDRVNPLISLDLREVSCSYDARGRFRKYEMPEISGDVKLKSSKQSTVKTKVKADTRVGQ